jgi:L-threonylcarbamoyladenylate synthase
MKQDVTSKALEALLKDGVCVFPAGTVYGLFCRALSPRAAAKIYKIKGRAENKPLQLFLSDTKDIYKYAIASPAVRQKVDSLLPGPYTVILKLKKAYGESFSFLKTGTAGFRVVKSKLINGIIKKLNEPLAATSANISGGKTPEKFKNIGKKVISKVSFAVKDDGAVKGIASKVLDFSGGKEKVIRP